MEDDVERDRRAVAFFTEGLGAGEACRYVGRLDDGRRSAATTANNGVDVRLFEASQPWTTVTSGVLDVDRLSESVYARARWVVTHTTRLPPTGVPSILDSAPTSQANRPVQWPSSGSSSVQHGHMALAPAESMLLASSRRS